METAFLGPDLPTTMRPGTNEMTSGRSSETHKSLTVGVVSSGHASGLGGALVRGLEIEGHRAAIIEEPAIRPTRLARAALEMRDRLPALAIADRTTALVDEVGKLDPDIVIIIKGVFVTVEAVRRLRSDATVVCWNPDSPFDSAISNNGGMVHSALPEYDLYVTWSERIAASLRDLRDDVVRIPFGIDPATHRPVSGKGIAAGRVVMIGTATKERAKMLDRFEDLKPLVFGNGWVGSPYDHHPPLVAAEFASIAGEARWCLNPLRPQNRDSHNMRTFELMACGARQLTFATEDHRRFLNGSNSKLADGVEHMVEIARECDPPTNPVDRKGEEHHYRHRCNELLASIRQLGARA